MGITFLIGNGFDIGLKLKTKYSEFYPYYLEKNHEDILSEDLKDNYDKWVDLEMALGQCLNKISEDQIEDFLDAKATLEADLVEYLRTESGRIRIDDRVANEFRTNVVEFYNEFNGQERAAFEAWKGKRAATIKYGFITFNYTDVLDRIITVVKKQLSSFSSHVVSSTTYSDPVLAPFHIHGTLDDDLILGVNDPSQVANENLRNDSRLLDYFVKEAINIQLGEQRIERAKKIIDESTYLCIFGMSLGETDQIWWEYILEWLRLNSQRRLVLYVYAEKTNNPSGSEKLRIRDLHRENFLKRAKASSQVVQEVKSRIIVIVRSSIFELEGVSVERKE